MGLVGVLVFLRSGASQWLVGWMDGEARGRGERRGVGYIRCRCRCRCICDWAGGVYFLISDALAVGDTFSVS